MKLLNVQQIARARQEAAPTLSHYDFLIRSVEEELKERVSTFSQPFKDILIYGARTNILKGLPFLKVPIFLNGPLNENDALPWPDHHFDLVVDCLTLHITNDIQHILKECWRILKPGGVFIAAFYGGETLRELRESFLHTELELTGGASLRIIPMIDLQTALALLQNAGFKEPITDREINTIFYPDLYHLLRDIKGMGEHQPFTTPPAFMRYHHFKRTEAYYQQHYSSSSNKLMATAEIIYMHGIK